MKIEILKILAEGCYKSFMTIELPNHKIHTIRISRNLYYELKDLGVITSQKLRYLTK